MVRVLDYFGNFTTVVAQPKTGPSRRPRGARRHHNDHDKQKRNQKNRAAKHVLSDQIVWDRAIFCDAHVFKACAGEKSSATVLRRKVRGYALLGF
jgi:hypothetical protein